MVSLHKLGHPDDTFLVNPDLIATIESCPDTVVRLTTGTTVMVSESPDEVAATVRAWRAGILARALATAPEPA